MQQGLKQVSGYGFGLLALAAFFSLCSFLFWPFSQLQPIFEQFNAEKATLYPWNSFAGNYGFTERTYWFAIGSFAGILIISFFLWFRQNRKVSFRNTLSFFSQRLSSVWQRMPLWEKWLVIGTGIVLFLVRLYFLFTSRIGGDEAASWIFFISKGLPGIIFYYPLPNNHILYNLLCLPLRYIFTDPYWTLELPTFFLSFIGSGIIYLAYRSVFPFLIVFFATTTFYFSQYALYFSVHGRGYFLVSICAALAALAIYKVYERKEQDHYWLVFLLCTVAGFYTIPVFLYLFLATSIFGAIAFCYTRNWLALKKLILTGIFAGLTTLLLYSPVLLASGAGLLFANHYVVSDPFEVFYKQFAFFFTYTQGAVLGQETFGFYAWLLGFTGILILLIFKARLFKVLPQTQVKPALLLLILCNLIFPWIFIFLQRVRPPERVLFYKGFFDLLAIGIVFYFIGILVLRKYPKLIVAGFLLFLTTYSAYQVNKAVRNENVAILDKGFDARIQAILKSGAKIIYGNEIYYTSSLRYEYFKHGPPDSFLGEYVFDPALNYNVLVLDKKKPVPPGLILDNYSLTFENSFVRIYYAKSFLAKSQNKHLLK